jgi:hypothetical protein
VMMLNGIHNTMAGLKILFYLITKSWVANVWQIWLTHIMMMEFATTNHYYNNQKKCNKAKDTSWCVLHTTLIDRNCQWLVAGLSFSSSNKTDSQDKTDILLKVALNTTILKLSPSNEKQF